MEPLRKWKVFGDYDCNYDFDYNQLRLVKYFFYSAGARDKWSQSPIKETKMKLYNTLYTRKPREFPTSHSENPN